MYSCCSTSEAVLKILVLFSRWRFLSCLARKALVLQPLLEDDDWLVLPSELSITIHEYGEEYISRIIGKTLL